MSAQIIDGKKIASEIREDVTRRVAALSEEGIKPGLAAILVGDDPASHVYVSSKEKAAQSAGMNSFVHRLPADTQQDALMELIASLNANPAVHGILLQIPIPKHLDPDAAILSIDPAKDVDGLHPQSVGLLAQGKPRFVSCTPLGVKVLLERTGAKVEGSHVVVVGRSNLVGRPVSILLSLKADNANATVTLCHTGTTNLEDHTMNADILIVAAGVPKGITGEMIKPGAIVIDVGITRGDDGKLIGDVDFESAKQIAGAITPVPGGVGPMTVAMLLSNTLMAAELGA
ncbi:MAG TPA: bifunctional 5,10-methylenetetrahydrofolate dehydrogenase/5,10-methenyltetrahydrofolate cyclohydrolase [Actinomycetota bacterium]|nr:bifunctional 5,10-methylenetetrahydrofolate dehydrogenase/5,10-methenyltetrahydrofolate cyclohydrolase [Actinomycetota bacterium]